jgi:replicative DNA helicase
MKTKAAEAIRAGIGSSVEAPVHPDQKDIEMKLLATLASVISADQGDQADRKDDLLELAAEDFHFQDHRAIFAAMKKLAAAGVQVDKAAVRAEVGDAWPDALAAAFDASNASAVAADAYKKKIILWADIAQARRIGADFLAAVDDAKAADLPGLVAGLQKAAFSAKTDRFAPPLKSEADMMDAFLLELRNPKLGYKTGFPHLQKTIRGLTPGLFVLAAPPSAGKTTFIKQLADQVAKLNEVPVLFFSYEQSAAELRIKSLARLMKTANETIKEGADEDGKKVDQGKLSAAVREYRFIGQWIKIIEGDRQYPISRIRLLAQREKKRTGKAPVIFIDYLQIIPVADPLGDRRAEVDAIVSDLRRVARDIEAPVIVISSMSRAEYKRARMSGFKESGGIEYGTDIAAILTVEDEKDGLVRTVALNIIKNRNGRRGKIGMTYQMDHDTFTETDFSHLNYMDTLGEDEDGREYHGRARKQS